MYAAVFGSQPVLRYPTFDLFSKQWYLGKSSLALKEFSPLMPLEGLNQVSFSNIRCHADKREKDQKRNKQVSARTEKGDQNQRPGRAFDGNRSKSPDQQEIIALLRRIQLSISKADSQGTPKRNSPPHKDKSSVEAILDVLRDSGKQVKDKVSKESTEKEALKTEPSSTLTRLPSNSVRKSPIPSIPAPRGRVLELEDESSAASGVEDKQGQSDRTLERMKLPELKELAKSKKIKGYSKLKKRELIQVLGS